MARGAMAERWNRASAAIATAYNCRQGVKKSMLVSPAAFHPFTPTTRRRLSREASRDLLNKAMKIDTTPRKRRHHGRQR